MTSSVPEVAETLEYTPTWVVALVCSIIVVVSVCAERFIHHFGKLLKRTKQSAPFEALQKLKEELMLLGFISLLLTVSQGIVNNICVPASVLVHMLPCGREKTSTTDEKHYVKHFSRGAGYRGRLLSEGAGSGRCVRQGKVPLLSLEALHHLHIFIFVLAVVHVLFCATTMVLGGAKIRKWKRWEDSIRNPQGHEKVKNDKHHHHEFTKRASGYWRKSAVVGWLISFFKQFHASVTKSDYLALRAGFIMTHCPTNPEFDFHEYMMRTLEADFKKVVGISWYLWLFVVIFLLLNVDGWHSYFWLSFLPLVSLLVVGAKLEHIITRLAQDADTQVTRLALDADSQASKDVESVGVKPSDEYFWFRRPYVVLYMIQFILFQNSFEIAFFFWILATYGFDSCIMEKVGYIVPRLVAGALIQVLCSYSTLPLYAIVSQMGEMFKKEIFRGPFHDVLTGWAAGVRGKKRANTPLSSFLKCIGQRSEGENSARGTDPELVASRAVQTDELDVELEEILASANQKPGAQHSV